MCVRACVCVFFEGVMASLICPSPNKSTQPMDTPKIKYFQAFLFALGI